MKKIHADSGQHGAIKNVEF